LAAGTVKSPYNWALSDWFNPPVIHIIEQKDNVIRVEVSDNVMVAEAWDLAGNRMQKEG